jgi:dimethylhistidine N-methyltransferase
MTAAAAHSYLDLSLVEEETRAAQRTRDALICEVHRGLLPQPRTLSPWIFYDAAGSRLFERITHLPEYYPTRTERQIFTGYADGIIAAARAGTAQPLRIVELGAGTASKTGILLDAAVRIQGKVPYIPVDVSRDALDQACESIGQTLGEVVVEPHVANYVTDPLQLPPFEGTTLALYIGSSIGNFSPDEARTILRNLRSQMRAGDALLLGTDMVKDERTLVAAYDDSDGVTAAFNLNMLRRLNKELGANFDLACFRHRARWNRAASRMEMHLESLKPQHVRIPAAKLDVWFQQGDTIHTENSYKFTRESIRALLEDSGFDTEQAWMDERAWFSVTLARVL